MVWRAESRASLAHGVGHQLPSDSSPGVPALGRVEFEPFCELPYAVAVGVGQNEHPLASMRGTDIRRSNTRPLRIEPCFGQLREDLVEPARAKLADIFHDDELRTNVANGSGKLEPQTAPSTSDARPRARAADVLTRKASAEDSRFGEVADRLDVAEVGYARPPSLQDAARVRVDFAVPRDLASEDGFRREVEPTDAREEGADRCLSAFIHHSNFRSLCRRNISATTSTIFSGVVVHP